jgi:hypothetical protein
MKPEERPGLGRKVVATDKGFEPAVVEGIDTAPAKPKLILSYCGAIVEVPDEDDKTVPEFIPSLVSGTERGMKSD